MDPYLIYGNQVGDRAESSLSLYSRMIQSYRGFLKVPLNLVTRPPGAQRATHDKTPAAVQEPVWSGAAG